MCALAQRLRCHRGQADLTAVEAPHPNQLGTCTFESVEAKLAEPLALYESPILEPSREQLTRLEHDLDRLSLFDDRLSDRAMRESCQLKGIDSHML